MGSKRNVPPRERMSAQNLIIRGVPPEYIEGTLEDYVQNDEVKTIMTRYLNNMHDMYEDRANLCLYGSNGSGKAQPLDELVLTPKGFKKMGDIKVGDLVISEDGQPTKVLQVYPQGKRPIYEITTDNGEKVKSDLEHLWKYKNKSMIARKQDWKVDTLKNIMKNNKIKRSKGFNITLPISDKVNFNSNVDLSLDPYLLGVLIADGSLTTKTPSISTSEEDIIKNCEKLLPPKHYIRKNSDFNFSWNIASKGIRENKVKKDLDKLKLNVKSDGKFIPHDYLIASSENRIKLLKGLMDTDGHISVSGSFNYSTISKQLKEDVLFLARSLGYKCSVTYDYRDKYSTGVCYNIIIQTNDCIFSSKKQLQRFEKYVKPINKYNARKSVTIVGIKYVGEEECQCIYVENPKHTYITGGFIVTHNTYLSTLIVKEAYRLRYSSAMTTVANLLDLTFKPKKTQEDLAKLKMYKEAEFLVLDEVGKENFTQSGSNINLVEECLRGAVVRGQVVIICTNLPLEGEHGLFNQYGNSIKSLINSYFRIKFEGDDYRPSQLRKKKSASILSGVDE